MECWGARCKAFACGLPQLVSTDGCLWQCKINNFLRTLFALQHLITPVVQHIKVHKGHCGASGLCPEGHQP